jgi:hypothetical protein
LGAALSAKSRKQWQCEECQRPQVTGSIYWYRTIGYGRETERIKYCGACRARALKDEAHRDASRPTLQ